MKFFVFVLTTFVFAANAYSSEVCGKVADLKIEGARGLDVVQVTLQTGSGAVSKEVVGASVAAVLVTAKTSSTSVCIDSDDSIRIK